MVRKNNYKKALLACRGSRGVPITRQGLSKNILTRIRSDNDLVPRKLLDINLEIGVEIPMLLTLRMLGDLSGNLKVWDLIIYLKKG